MALHHNAAPHISLIPSAIENAIIFQHASLESIDTIVDAFHSVATILLIEGIMQTHVGYICFLWLHCINLASF